MHDEHHASTQDPTLGFDIAWRRWKDALPLTRDQIAILTGCTKEAVRKRMALAGIKPSHKSGRKVMYTYAQYSAMDAALDLGLSAAA